ncbi:LysR family transcriptional regulator [Thermobifida halotolerans]|uniref:LysR family transcriptional regulator n=2 Tax=Thermobifida halotolerans TaxID=483545 RepID=A0AA97M5I5_9ACTN|nr:LysR family transcriptional regulator [Thermobifida halotolerans]
MSSMGDMSFPHALNTVWLQVFTTVARHGSFTAAAREMDYTQSAVSRQICALEEAAGAPLFDRLPRGVRLTEQGRVLLEHAEAVLERLETAHRDLVAVNAAAVGRLRVGTFASAGAELVPTAIAALRARHPGVDVTVREEPSPRLAAALVAGDLDVAVLTPAAGDLLDELDPEPLFHDGVSVMLPRTHRLADRACVRLGDLADEDWIVGRDTPVGPFVAAALDTGFRPRIRFVVAEWIAKQGFAAAGLGVALVPSWTADVVRPDLAVVPVHPDDVPPRTVYTATARGVSPSPAVAAFLTVLEETAARVRANASPSPPPAGPGARGGAQADAGTPGEDGSPSPHRRTG